MTLFGSKTQWLRLAVGVVGGAAAAVAAMAAFGPVTVHAQPSRVTVCHISGNANDTYLAPGLVGVTPPAEWVFGQLIEVNENAVDAHLGHGDSATRHPPVFRPFLGGTYWTTEELFDLTNFGNAWVNVFAQGQFPNADCGIRNPIF